MCFVGVAPLVEVVTLFLIGVDFGFDAKYAELLVSSSFGSFVGCFFLGVADFVGFTDSSSSSSSETTFRPRPFFAGFFEAFSSVVGVLAAPPPPPKKDRMSPGMMAFHTDLASPR